MRIKTMAAFLAALTTLCQGAAAQESGFLKIVALEGEGAFNDIRRKIARDPVVEVRDEANRVVAGAPVVFSLPDSGPSGTFAGGSRIFTATTDAQGRARGEGLKPNSIEGRFNIKVTASASGRSGTAVISQ